MATKFDAYKNQLPDVRLTDQVLSFKDFRRDEVFHADVIIVGSGAGGSVAAMPLAEAGLDVLVLEEGPLVTTKDFSLGATTMLRRLYRDAGTAMIKGSPNILFAEGRCVGGSTVLYGGMMWRAPEKVLHRWRMETGLPKITAEDMEPYFQQAEHFTHAAKQIPESIGNHNKYFRDAALNLGYEIKEHTRSQNYCVGTNNCMYGCPQGAKLTALNTTIPRAVRLGARLATNCLVDRVLITPYNQAQGVEGRFVDDFGRPSYRFQAFAPLVILAAGAQQSPGILMRSGLKKKNRLLGQNLMVHPNAKAIGILQEEINGWDGAHQAYKLDRYLEEGLVLAAVMPPPALLAMSLPQYGADLGEMMSHYNRMLSTGFLLEDTTTGYVKLGLGGKPSMHYNITEFDNFRIKRATALLAELLFAAGSRKVYTGIANVPPLTSPDQIPRLFDPKIKRSQHELLTVHIMGSASMGADPRRSVTNEWGMFHGIRNLFIQDASLFPTGIGVNPTLTIMALVFRNMEHILENHEEYFGKMKKAAAPGASGNGGRPAAEVKPKKQPAKRMPVSAK